MKRKELALLVLALAEGKPYSPVRIQKALFLATSNLPQLVDKGPSYSFQAYDYGPFDKAVYGDLRELASDGLAELPSAWHDRWTEYQCTSAGQEEAQRIKDQVADDELEYLAEVSKFVRSLSFSQLVSAIYKAYPEMKKNSIFVE